ncbi:uncharacterized protein LOC142339679 [Convolutriloba macropyga]|uniref:uncharacterized protein LOC142339679 n=1 Tax=Convolutriloba macropyga TaxID=536237 RepID=UPI003F520196
MDDFIQTFSTEEEAANTATELKPVLKTGGFNLTKFLSNNPAVLEKIPEKDRVGIQKLQRIFGQTWNLEFDQIPFAKPRLSYEKENITQRKLLSMAASLFDTNGLFSLFAIRLRCILQKVIKQGHNWDQLLSKEHYDEIQQWMEDFQNMPPIQIPRCLVPNVDGTHQLHTFTDASLSAVSAVLYLRTISVDDTIATHYVISKSKVAPIKQMSIPKLELEAATLGAQLAGFCETEMTIDLKNKMFWTDSTAVLSWIKSKDQQKMYIANRLNKIDENSNKDDGLHVPGKMNPADHGTRGLAPCGLQKLWITAPSFLIKTESEWTFSGDKTAQTYATQVDVKTSEKPLVDPNRLSNWPRHLGTIRTVFWAVRVLKRLIKGDVACDLHDFAADENKARNFLLRISQSTHFKDTVSRLQSGLPLDKKDKLLPYTPFLDSDGLPRVEGRIQKSGLPFQSKHPVILDSRCRVAKMLIEKTHHDCGHHGIEHARAHIQATLIIVGIRRALRTLGKYCFICRRWRADNVRPKVTSLPKFRFPEYTKIYPFVNTGMDMFGPFHIEKSRTQTELNYVCIFTFLVTRAVHLEVCEDISTDCLLTAIRRFVSGRGYPDVIVSDNGNNFVGANQAMKLNFQENFKPDNNYKRLQLAQQNIQWTSSPLLAPHFGGVWERLIQSAKRSLLFVLGNRRLNFSVLHTVVSEAEGILNSRQLTHVGSTLIDEEPLTPNHFLIRRRHFFLKTSGKQQNSVFN